jgi:hypothetical protein
MLDYIRLPKTGAANVMGLGATSFHAERGVGRGYTSVVNGVTHRWPNSWGLPEYASAVASGNFPLVVQVPEGVDAVIYTPPGTGIGAPSNLAVSGANVTWTHGSATGRTGYYLWISEGQGGTKLAGTTDVTITTPSASALALSRLAPPATEYWINIQATGIGTARSPTVSLNRPVSTEFPAPTQVCANFGTNTITWAYTNNSANPVLGFHVLIGSALYAITGPNARSVARAAEDWVAGETTVTVKAFGAGAETQRAVTLTAAGQTNGSSCNP